MYRLLHIYLTEWIIIIIIIIIIIRISSPELYLFFFNLCLFSHL
jgi:hypothetical protein